MSTIIYNLETKNQEKSLFTKESPYLAKIKNRFVLNKKNSSKKTFHLSLDITGSNLTYEEGDAIAILPTNNPLLVETLLGLLNASGDEILINPRSTNNEAFSLKTFLSKKINLTKVSPAFLKLAQNYTRSPSKQALLNHLLVLENKQERTNYLESHDLITCIQELKPEKLPLQEVINTVAPLLPRFYSIASSYSKYPNQIDLLVATFSYFIQDQERNGIGSDFLCSLSDDTTPIPIYLQSNHNFKLPKELSTPIIMIGAGTGIAPYKAFLEKRTAAPCQSKNWLFFGERQKAYDFYYEDQLTHYEKENLLKLSTAFSRDQPDKIYVQHKLAEEKKLLWEWIQEGSYIYLCGDAKQMAKDVTETFLQIFESEGNLSPEEAKSFLNDLRKSKRFQIDVY